MPKPRPQSLTSSAGERLYYKVDEDGVFWVKRWLTHRWTRGSVQITSKKG
ncbi:hypothetical protein AVV06_gp18 [Mycobacterium phage Chadwick]|uniref:Uncharacterized protein n=1 Tax=Mycobacterium phage Chadwick TaxID=1698366 RepID=A0A0K2CMY9_9CAUD|nr:hypothetical protein AVV06_gp18 [Mycobacterium phage Chadwick]ALA06804.1 hypothetical protein SEA_CHADWICK_77 [Mycobacterium phage Chadwick]